MGDVTMVAMMSEILHDPWQKAHMGIAAENVAEHYGITREMQGEAACDSHRRACAAITAGYFREQIVPVEIASRKGLAFFDADEHPRADAMDGFAKLRPFFKKNGMVATGNASSLNDGAAAIFRRA
jgi:acetyl-CoA C-acetyltransferase